ncbi:3'-5' exonuclease [Kitasatospora sp. NBC_00315]|uniref:HelD family protein n=1 Tax=Kitasatospora sp. NBC_00315 TaxID=2975963 RepID=UPI0032457B55
MVPTPPSSPQASSPSSPQSPSSETDSVARAGAGGGSGRGEDGARPADGWRAGQLRVENAYVDELYDRLETQRELATAQLREIHRRDSGGTQQSRLERDAMEAHHTRRLSELHAAEYGLCFGRIENADGERRYIGRIALADEDHEPLLTDWRASAAEPFYRATPAAPGGVTARRHLRSKGRTVVDFDDDAFGVSALEGRAGSELSGESALLASLTAARTGRMGDIVSTIQAEQDRVIRSELGGVMVVQGGPGTGKTVVALHRAAYLLYTHRDRLAKRGVLMIGPNTTFLRYIDQVLPALGESEVVLSSIGTLYPGVTATGTDSPEAAAVKGDARMTGVLAAALEGLRQLPEESWTIVVGRRSPYHVELVISRAMCERARAEARRTGEPHNAARAALVERLSSELALRIARDRGGDMDLDDVANLADALVDEPEFQDLTEKLWPLLSPEQLVTALFGSPELLATAMPDFSGAERAAVRRERPARDGEAPSRTARRTWSTWTTWSAADVPLLDEAAELLGPLPGNNTPRQIELAAEAAELEFAKIVLDDFGVGLVEMDAQMLARQYRGERSLRPLADRAAEDRTWGFGHVIVDEAQELSPMDWRMLTRRCPGRSMTIVGDLAQTGAPAGLSSWGEALDAYTAGRWRTVELTVNYRTPAEIMRVTEGVLRAVDPKLAAPTAVRAGGHRPWSLRIPEDGRGAALRSAVEKEIAALDGGRTAIIHAADCPPELLAGLTESDAVAAFTDGPSALDSPVVLMTAAQAKGLEFDTVLVLEPAEILAAHSRGANDLYVALTRATKRLGVIHSRELPEMLEGLDPR